LFYNDDIRDHMARQKLSAADFFSNVITAVFQEFPEVDGLILRVGENDGKDVTGTFLSQLGLQTPAQAKQLLQQILPVFEEHGKTLIFRTWTVGAYKIGDLIWNEQTFDAVFSSITSQALIISMKFGDTDFMRYLKLNPLFFAGPHKKIIELQTRREWEGMGLYPSFVGWDYEQYFQELADNDQIVGLHVWCQTGGWAQKAWTNLTFLEGSSFWNELNTFVTIRIYKEGCSAEAAIERFCAERHISNIKQFTKLLRLSDVAIHQGLYIREAAYQPRYFRRTRLPSLLWISWDKILIQPALVHVLRALVSRPQAVITEAEEAIIAVKAMTTIAEQLHLDAAVTASLHFELATFTLFAKLKAYLLGVGTTDSNELQKQIDEYTARYPQHYIVPALKPLPAGSRMPGLIRAILRTHAPYRVGDRLLLATSPLQRWLVRYYLGKATSHLADQSMGIEILFT
jgi:hypothetical protein